MRIFRSARPVGAHKSLFLHWHAMANGIVVLPVFLPQFDNHLCLSLLHALAYALAHPFLGFCLNYSSAHYIHQPFFVLVSIGNMCDDSMELPTNNCCKYIAIFIAFLSFCLNKSQQLFFGSSYSQNPSDLPFPHRTVRLCPQAHKEQFAGRTYELLERKPDYGRYLADLRLAVLNEYIEFIEDSLLDKSQAGDEVFDY